MVKSYKNKTNGGVVQVSDITTLPSERWELASKLVGETDDAQPETGEQLEANETPTNSKRSRSKKNKHVNDDQQVQQLKNLEQLKNEPELEQEQADEIVTSVEL